MVERTMLYAKIGDLAPRYLCKLGSTLKSINLVLKWLVSSETSSWIPTAGYHELHFGEGVFSVRENMQFTFEADCSDYGGGITRLSGC